MSDISRYWAVKWLNVCLKQQAVRKLPGMWEAGRQYISIRPRCDCVCVFVYLCNNYNYCLQTLYIINRIYHIIISWIYTRTYLYTDLNIHPPLYTLYLTPKCTFMDVITFFFIRMVMFFLMPTRHYISQYCFQIMAARSLATLKLQK